MACVVCSSGGGENSDRVREVGLGWWWCTAGVRVWVRGGSVTLNGRPEGGQG